MRSLRLWVRIVVLTPMFFGNLKHLLWVTPLSGPACTHVARLAIAFVPFLLEVIYVFVADWNLTCFRYHDDIWWDLVTDR